MALAELKQELNQALVEVFGDKVDPAKASVSFTGDAQFGDIATNAAMVYAKDLGSAPREVAAKLVSALEKLSGVEKVSVAGPGFINLTMSDEWLSEVALSAHASRPNQYQGQVVVTEYSDPNPFKVLHVGHLYTSVVGDAIANLIRAAGGEVHTVNFGGDVGRHVAITMWAIIKELGGEHPEGLEKIGTGDHAAWMAKRYVEGTRAYGEDEQAQKEIKAYNERVYKLHAEADHDSPFAKIYWTCRQWSYDYFDSFYERIGSHFEKYYPESVTTDLGLETVRAQLKRGVYKESQGAIVFEGEPYGLHTRVFITSQGLPTYEAKDVGLIMNKWKDYHFDKSVVITGNDITDYMKVVLKSIEQFEPDLVARSVHLTHGNVKLSGGVKMSSRMGNFLTAVDVLDAAADANRSANNKDDDRVTLGAVKYAFLKSRLGMDMVYIPEESVSLDGNSGPYLQYAHARARSILAKSTGKPAGLKNLEAGERLLARKLVEYPDVLSQAVTELAPHVVCTYLYELAQVFNRFYEGNRVIGDAREGERLALVRSYADVLRDGIQLLGIAAPDRL
jgi:arginyl-tRNA synthetase